MSIKSSATYSAPPPPFSCKPSPSLPIISLPWKKHFFDFWTYPTQCFFFQKKKKSGVRIRTLVCEKKKQGLSNFFFSKKYTCFCILRNKYMSSSQSKTRIRSNWVRLSCQVKFVNWKHSFLNLRNAVLGGWMYSNINRNNKCPWIFFRYRRVSFKYPLVKSDFQKVFFSDIQIAHYNQIKKKTL